MRYLVTGGLGVIGSHFARQKLEEGHEVEIIDACEEPRNEWVWNRLRAADRLKLLCVDEARLEEMTAEDLLAAVEEADYVVHAAAHTGIPHSLVDPVDDWRSNVDATRLLLEAVRRQPRPTIVLSSVKPYRVPRDLGSGLREDHLLEPDEPYAASKAAQSLLCQAYARSYGVPVTVFRCSNLYGPAPCHGPRHGWITWFCIAAAIGRPIEVQGTGEQSRDILHAGDVAAAVDLALADLCGGGRLRGEVCNLGGGYRNVVSVNQVAKLLQELAGAEVKRGPARAMDDDRVFADSGKFRDLTGWEPRIYSLDGVREVLAWAQANKTALAKLYEGI